jgi:iron(III) transport system substrate-binding protein
MRQATREQNMGETMLHITGRAMTILAFLCGLGASAAVGQTLPAPVVDGETIGTPDLVKAACAEGAVVYYTGQSADDERRIIEPFTRQFPCIKVSLISEVSGRLYERIRTEVSAGKIQADIALLTDPQITQELIEQKVVKTWHPPMEASFPDNGKLPGWWYAALGTPFYPIFNTQAVKEGAAPAEWKDLLDPKYAGKISTASISVGGTGWIQYAFFRYKLGDDYLKAFVAQNPRMLNSYTAAAVGVARGEFPVGVVASVNDYPIRVLQHGPIKAVYPSQGMPFIPFAMMLMTGSPHPAAGELFANWYLSKQGQSSAVKQRGTYSWRKDVAPPEGAPADLNAKFWYPGVDFILKNHDALIDELRQLTGGK